MGQTICCEEIESKPFLEGHDDFPRVHVFSINLHKADGARLGLDLDFVKGREVLPVRAVMGHLTEEWNRSHPESKVQSGDRIVEVNGTKGRSDLLMKALMGNDKLLHITLVRAEEAKDTKTVYPFPKQQFGFQEEFVYPFPKQQLGLQEEHSEMGYGAENQPLVGEFDTLPMTLKNE